MATTNINNLDGLDAVTYIGAGGETTIKECVKKALSKLSMGDPRVLDLFVGQMAAEGFNGVVAGTLYTVESPTVKIEVIKEAAGQHLIRVYVLVSAAWVKVGQMIRTTLG
jgi:hypothetical protein